MFSRTDKVTDSERFFTSLFDLLDDPMEKKEVEALLGWWNRYVACSLCLCHLLYLNIQEGLSSCFS